MIKEQEEAIEKLEYYLKNSAYKRENSDFFKNGGWEVVDLEIPKSIETVLSMLKEKDKEIEHWKNGFERELEDNRKNTCELLKQDLIIRAKDKQIDLMADFIYKIWCDYPGSIFHKLKEAGFDESKCGFCEHSDRMCKDCLKQYFERKAEQC